MASVAEWMTGIGSGMSGLSSLGSLIYSIITSGRETEAQHMARRQWERLREPVARVFRQTYFAPWVSGLVPPYSDLTQSSVYRWAPAPGVQELYKSYLSRTYGLPRSIARTMVATTLKPLRFSPSLRGAVTPLQFSRFVGPAPQELAQAALKSHMPSILRSQDYLKNAARLAAFNLMRAQQLPYLIG